MVGSINAPTTGNTFDAFKAAAVKIGGSEVTVSLIDRVDIPTLLILALRKRMLAPLQAGSTPSPP
jgi:hypothetical protein